MQRRKPGVARVAKLQSTFEETIKQLKGGTNATPVADGSVSLTAQEARGLEDTRRQPYG